MRTQAKLHSQLTKNLNRPDLVLSRSAQPLRLELLSPSPHLNSWSHMDLRYVGNVLGAVQPTLACCQHRDGGSRVSPGPRRSGGTGGFIL